MTSGYAGNRDREHNCRGIVAKPRSLLFSFIYGTFYINTLYLNCARLSVGTFVIDCMCSLLSLSSPFARVKERELHMDEKGAKLVHEFQRLRIQHLGYPAICRIERRGQCNEHLKK